MQSKLYFSQQYKNTENNITLNITAFHVAYIIEIIDDQNRSFNTKNMKL